METLTVGASQTHAQLLWPVVFNSIISLGQAETLQPHSCGQALYFTGEAKQAPTAKAAPFNMLC